ncbi:MAG: Gfo/Idh/MocA family oxidoreductase [Litorilinea sp.]
MQTVKAALLGVEHPHSAAHLRTLQQLPEVESIVLWDTNADALVNIQQNNGAKVTHTSTDLAAILADPELTIVIAALRNDLGPDIFLQVIKAGKHLMAEKPIGKTADDSLRVLQAAQAKGVKLGVCYQNRYIPAVKEARRIVQEGLLGELISLELRMLTTQVQFRKPQHWLFSKDKAGGGMLSWLGCHYIDLMRHLAGDEIVSVAAHTATRNGEDIDVEDIAALSMGFGSGAIGSLHAGYVLALSGSGYHNRGGYDTYIGVNGRLGRLTFATTATPPELYVETTHPAWADAPTRRFQYTPGESPAYGGVAGENFIRRFIQAAQGDGEPAATGADAFQVARIIDAAYASDRDGRRIDIAQPAPGV